MDKYIKKISKYVEIIEPNELIEDNLLNKYLLKSKYLSLKTNSCFQLKQEGGVNKKFYGYHITKHGYITKNPQIITVPKNFILITPLCCGMVNLLEDNDFYSELENISFEAIDNFKHIFYIKNKPYIIYYEGDTICDINIGNNFNNLYVQTFREIGNSKNSQIIDELLFIYLNHSSNSLNLFTQQSEYVKELFTFDTYSIELLVDYMKKYSLYDTTSNSFHFYGKEQLSTNLMDIIDHFFVQLYCNIAEEFKEFKKLNEFEELEELKYFQEYDGSHIDDAMHEKICLNCVKILRKNHNNFLLKYLNLINGFTSKKDINIKYFVYPDKLTKSLKSLKLINSINLNFSYSYVVMCHEIFNILIHLAIKKHTYNLTEYSLYKKNTKNITLSKHIEEFKFNQPILNSTSFVLFNHSCQSFNSSECVLNNCNELQLKKINSTAKIKAKNVKNSFTSLTLAVTKLKKILYESYFVISDLNLDEDVSQDEVFKSLKLFLGDEIAGIMTNYMKKYMEVYYKHYSYIIKYTKIHTGNDVNLYFIIKMTNELLDKLEEDN